MTRKRRSSPAGADERAATTSGIEWLVAIIGVALVVGSVALLLHEAVTGGSAVPSIRAEVIDVRSVDGSHRVQVRVANRGQTTAAEVKIAAVLAHQDGAETSDTVIDYLAPASSRNVTFAFDRDPRTARLSIRVISYLDL
jgi:uncharacterized protein (TIGR02588 family)